MRGKGKTVQVQDDIIRITPAYAGKSITGVFYGTKGVGSPPPMRGKVVFHMKFVQHHRITPAYAGKSGKTLIL